jgi:succinate-semialdehyde dehydrogenase/glutarate-semialdehyde dehydrogenase
MKNFCPVASFYRVKNEQEAIDLANDSPFGLVVLFYTQDMERALKRDQIRFCMVSTSINQQFQPDLPFGEPNVRLWTNYSKEFNEFVNKKLIRIS